MKSVFWTFSIFVCLAFPAADGNAADTWIDISDSQTGQLGKQPWPGGCAGTVVNRLNGDVMVNMVGNGLWKTSDQGKTWSRLDGGVVSGALPI
jgi:hypothetical protein